MTRRRLLVWFAVVLALSAVSRWRVLRANVDRCSLDGNRIVPVHRVDLMLDGRVLESFCCVTCALEWPRVPEGAAWQVHDEVTGEPLDARRARFVVSRVVTVPSRQDRIHAFRDGNDALDHIAQYDGAKLPNPFAPRGNDDP